MKIPAQAFAQLYPKDLAPGCLFLFRDKWAVRVTGQADFQGFLMLEGERTGQVFGVSPGMAQSVAIVDPFSWFPMVAINAKPVWGTSKVPTLALTVTQPILVGVDADDSWGPNYLAYTVGGQGISMQELNRTAHFDQWSVELCHKDRPCLSLGVLLEIDGREEPDLAP